LGLLPLIKNNLIDQSNIIADVKSGISGAGKKEDTNLLMAESAENFKAYALQGHRHLPEIEENLSSVTQDKNVKLIFVPHLLPIVRGIHATMYVDAIKDFDISESYHKFYGEEPFVDILPQGECPETKSVRSSNICRISFQKQKNSNKIIILSVIDNLVKGAAGQAIQNMNIMMNYDETDGLNLVPLAP
jgi:N-acetyl-gamma-glutamyl-phosphate reductase (EC 1.2.1.38)